MKYTKFNHTKGIHLHRIKRLIPAAICSSYSVHTNYTKILQMRAITFIHCMLPVLANFMQRVDLSDSRGTIGKEIKQKNRFLSLKRNLYCLCKSVFCDRNLRKNTILEWLVSRQVLCNECKNDKTKNALCKCYYGISFALALCVLRHLLCIKFPIA